MATTLASEEQHDDRLELRAVPGGNPLSARAAWLWTMFGLALLGTFIALVVEDFPLRGVFAGQ